MYRSDREIDYNLDTVTYDDKPVVTAAIAISAYDYETNDKFNT